MRPAVAPRRPGGPEGKAAPIPPAPGARNAAKRRRTGEGAEAPQGEGLIEYAQSEHAAAAEDLQAKLVEAESKIAVLRDVIGRQDEALSEKDAKIAELEGKLTAMSSDVAAPEDVGA